MRNKRTIERAAWFEEQITLDLAEQIYASGDFTDSPEQREYARHFHYWRALAWALSQTHDYQSN